MAYVMRGVKKGKVLVNNGYRYQLNKKKATVFHWRCWRKTCRTTLSTNAFNLDEGQPQIEIKSVNEHDHTPEDNTLREAEAINQMKETIKDDPTKPIKRVYNEVIEGCIDNYEDDDLPEFQRVRSILHRQRESVLPRIPRNVDDVRIRGEWKKTWSGKRFLSHHDNNWGIAIFATTESLRLLQGCSTVYVDGTFKSSPHPYTQMVTIHGKYMGRFLTFAWSLMTGKTVGHYRQFFQHLKSKVRHATGRRFRPRTVVCDFETALKLAVETELPQSTLSACYFHFTQSIWRKIQEVGLARAYRRRRRVNKLLRKMMSIGHLPLLLVRQNFHMLANSPDTLRLRNRYPEITDLLTYFQNTYLDGNFPPQIWNVFNRDKDTRTNNLVEGFHSQWNSSVGCKHPSIWIFIRKLKDAERLQKITLRAAMRGEHAPRTRRKWRRLQRQISNIKLQYNNGQRNISEYWNGISHCIKHYR